MTVHRKEEKEVGGEEKEVGRDLLVLDREEVDNTFENTFRKLLLIILVNYY